MSPQVDLSILIPSVPERFDQMRKLYDKLQQQVGCRPAEILVSIDNRKRSIGLKRDMLVQGSRGRYISFVDDDDDISPGYVDEILGGIRAGNNPDVVVFDQYVQLNNQHPFIVSFGLEYEVEQATMFEGSDVYRHIKRKPFHICAWRGELARSQRFEDQSTTEDWAWAKPLCAKAKTQWRINKVLHFYKFNDATTAAAKARELDS